ncbi:MAG: hypothetical protein JSS27_16060 [Planctomycetes bacterium]|nr:hypothetical protein [Planctomycetota bacterium]
MSTTTERQADHEEADRARAEKRPVAAEAAKRIHDRAERIRERLYKEHGLLNVAVELVRETRDE